MKAFPEAHRLAYKLKIDFDADIGIKNSSAQIKDFYTMKNLLHKQVSAVVNFPPKQIGPFMSTRPCWRSFFSQKEELIKAPCISTASLQE